MKKILLSTLILVAVIGLGIKATMAYFSDTGTSSKNIFQAGRLDLKLSDNDEVLADNVTFTLTGSDMKPGGDPITAQLKIRNGGIIAGNHIHLAITANDIVEGDGSVDPSPMDQNLEIVSLTYGGLDILGSITNINGNTFKDLDDWEKTAAPGIGPFSLTDLGTDHILNISVHLAQSTPDSNQGDQVTTTLSVLLHQDASQ